MPGALLGATSCGRCGQQQGQGASCRRCGTRWAAAAAATVTPTDPGPLAGVIRVSRGRRSLAQLVDLGPLVVLLALGVAGAVGTVTLPVPAWVPIVLALLGVVALASTLAVWGRSAGRWLLRQRTVDDLTGTPVRPGRFLRRLGAVGRRHYLTADLRRGGDPLRLRLTPPTLATPAGAPVGPAGEALDATARPTRPVGAAPRPSIGIVLDSGECYEIHHSLLIGRSPVDPGADTGRALLAWPDLSRRLARTHLLLEWSGTVLWVTDLNSATGTAVVTAGGDRLPLAPGVRAGAPAGSRIECGGRTIEVVPRG